MSTPPGDAQTRTRGRGGNVFTQKIGPLPMWVWLIIAAVLVIGYAWLQSKKAASSSSAATGTATGTNASQVPQFVNQTYVTGTPPSAQHMPPSGHPGGGTKPPTTTTTGTGATSTPSNAGTTAASPGSNVSGLVGTPLSQALAYLQNQGITLNTVLGPNGQPVSPSQYGSSNVVAAQYFAQGVAGQNFANSATLAVG
jgi:hypothetical protein